MKFWNRPTVAQPVQPEPLAKIDFADVEAAFLKRHRVGLTSTGALVIAAGGSFHVPKQGEFESFLKSYLISQGLSRQWSVSLVNDFREWLMADAATLDPNTFIRGN